MSVTILLPLLAWFVLGLATGGLHFLTLRWNVQLLTSGRPLVLGLAAQLLRLALTGGALAVVAIEGGAIPLLIAGAGILAARAAAVWQARRAL
jgi:F1F0 ATPase subunit 2